MHQENGHRTTRQYLLEKRLDRGLIARDANPNHFRTSFHKGLGASQRLRHRRAVNAADQETLTAQSLLHRAGDVELLGLAEKPLVPAGRADDEASQRRLHPALDVASKRVEVDAIVCVEGSCDRYRDDGI